MSGLSRINAVLRKAQAHHKLVRGGGYYYLIPDRSESDWIEHSIYVYTLANDAAEVRAELVDIARSFEDKGKHCVAGRILLAAKEVL